MAIAAVGAVGVHFTAAQAIADAAVAEVAATGVSSFVSKPNTAFFWSGRTNGVGGASVAEAIASARGGTTLEMLIARKGIVMPTWDAANPDSIAAWNIASAEYASNVSGEIRAIIGSNLRPGNTWETVELPILKANPRVTKITTINPQTQTETVIFQR